MENKRHSKEAPGAGRGGLQASNISYNRLFTIAEVYDLFRLSGKNARTICHGQLERY